MHPVCTSTPNLNFLYLLFLIYNHDVTSSVRSRVAVMHTKHRTILLIIRATMLGAQTHISPNAHATSN